MGRNELPDDLKFTAKDFNFDVTIEGHENCDPEPRHLADRANAILAAKLAKAPEVFGCQLGSSRECSYLPIGWDRTNGPSRDVDTHRARLVCIEKIEGKE